jgi:hypothetical protein
MRLGAPSTEQSRSIMAATMESAGVRLIPRRRREEAAYECGGSTPRDVPRMLL